MGCIRVLYIFNLVFWDKRLDLKSLICAEYARFAVIILELMSFHILFPLSITDPKYVKLPTPSKLNEN
jgi:hypothetical protein